MLKKISYPAVVVLLLITASLFAWFNYKNNTKSVAGVSSEVNWSEAKGLIVPHHVLADGLITSAYSKLTKDSYEYIVILGPNHFFPERNIILTADSLPGANIDGYKAYNLSTNQAIDIDNDLVANDHSITSQLPYIREYFPSAKLIALLVSPYYSVELVDDVVNNLYAQLPENTLYIASVDFSHETLRIEALERNKESITALENHDYEKISGFTDLNTDSPLSLILLGKLTSKYGAVDWETIASSHASLVEDDETIRGTSYVTGVYLPQIEE